MILADSCAFFTLFHTISSCFHTPYQVGRGVSASHSSELEIASNVSRAVKDGKWVLATHDQITLPSFPCSEFSLVIEYSESRSNITIKHNEFQKWISLRTKNPLQVELSIRNSSAHGSKEKNAEIGLTATGCSQIEESVPIIVSEKSESLFNRRRSLFESVLRFERQGALIVHRDLGLLVDAALPPCSALCLWEINSTITDNQVR